ncbi:MAG: beta-propeller fold lactonase family protein [Rhodospirillales bacterium]|nr:beta-propeller fold lactonase family protein [Rhodospirillales bacterium]
MTPQSLARTVLAVVLVASAIPAGGGAKAQDRKAYSEPQLLKQSGPHFSMPGDLAITPDGSYLLVADTGNNEIKVLQPGTLDIVSRFGDSSLDTPQRLEFTSDGLLLVADRNDTRVTVYKFNGVYRDGSANVKQLEVRPATITPPPEPPSITDANGLRYVIEMDENRIMIFDEDRNQISAYGADHLNAPNAVETVGRYFWIADTGNNRILLLKAPLPNGP